MDMNRLKQDVGQTWQRLAEGWRSLSGKAANALTHFTPGREEESDSVSWGLLAAEVRDHENTVTVSLEAPGLDKNDIDIDVDDRHLIVTGHKHYESERKEGTTVISERAFGHFQRAIPLPEKVTAEGANASYRNGVLTVELPKLAPPEARKIRVVGG